MFLAEGNLVFVQRSSNLSEGAHIFPTQASDLETNLECFGAGGVGGGRGETNNLNQKKDMFWIPPTPHRALQTYLDSQLRECLSQMSVYSCWFH